MDVRQIVTEYLQANGYTIEALYGDYMGVPPNSEPLGPCQWDMALINASEDGSYQYATGAGVKVGVIDEVITPITPMRGR